MGIQSKYRQHKPTKTSAEISKLVKLGTVED